MAECKRTRRLLGAIRSSHVGIKPAELKADGIDIILLRDAIGRVVSSDVGKLVYSVETRHEFGGGRASITTHYEVESDAQRDRRLKAAGGSI